ncbi:hypothetical protein [Nocardia nova]|nr:hypothetical protein [Nocardia nova]
MAVVVVAGAGDSVLAESSLPHPATASTADTTAATVARRDP